MAPHSSLTATYHAIYTRRRRRKKGFFFSQSCHHLCLLLVSRNNWISKPLNFEPLLVMVVVTFLVIKKMKEKKSWQRKSFKSNGQVVDPIRYATVDTHCENLTLLGLGDGWRHDSTCLVVGSGCCVEEGKKGSRSRSSQVVVVVALRVFIHGYILCVRPPCYKLIQSVIFGHIRNGQTRWAVVVLPWRGSRREEKHGGFQVCNLFLPRHSLLLFFLPSLFYLTRV